MRSKKYNFQNDFYDCWEPILCTIEIQKLPYLKYDFCRKISLLFDHKA